MFDDMVTIPVVDWFFIFRQSDGSFGVGVEDVDNRGAHNIMLPFVNGYSGAPGFVNDPAAEHLPGRGPIPRGRWFTRPAFRHERLGPAAIGLIPMEGWEVPGNRSGFYIHGDNSSLSQTASNGCIILPRQVRDFINRWPGRELRVTS